MMGKYKLDNIYEYAGEFGAEDVVVSQDEYNDNIAEIEERVNKALDLIEQITGIDSIEECTNVLLELSNDLY